MRDALLVAAAVLIAGGVTLFYVPLGLVVTGVLLGAFVLLSE